MKRISYFLAFLFLPGSVLCQQTDTLLNLDQCIAIAIKNNLDVNRRSIQAEAAKINYRQQQLNVLPDLNAGVSHRVIQGRGIDPATNGYVNDRVFNSGDQSISSSVLLFNGMGLQHLIKQYSLAYQAALQEEQQAKDNLSLNVTLAYLQVLTNEELLRLATNQQATTGKQAERLELLNASGTISPGDYYDLKGQYANDQLSLIGSGNALENAKVALAQLLNIPYQKSLKLARVRTEQFSLIYEATQQQVYETALQKLAVVKAADLRSRSAAMQVKAVKATFFPIVNLNGGYSSNFSGTDPAGYFSQVRTNKNRYASLGLSIPIFNGLRAKNNVSLARLSLRENQLVAENTRVQIQQLTAQAYVNMNSERERYLTLNMQVGAYTESFRTAEIRFNAGVINSVDYLVAKNNLERARLNLVVSSYDYILRKKILDFYQGKALGM